MSYTFGSFNLSQICKMYRDNQNTNGTPDSREKYEKTIHTLGKIIKREEFDIIGFQEIHSSNYEEYNDIFRDIKKEIDDHWTFFCRESKEEKYHRHGEGFALLWNTRRIQLVDNTIVSMIGEKDSYPNLGGVLVRPPMYARFTPAGLQNGNVEFRVIMIHLVHGKSNVKQERQNEFAFLRDEIYPRIADATYFKNSRNSFTSYTVIMGDYNLCLFDTPLLCDNPMHRDPLKGTIDCEMDGQRVLRTVQAKKTTLKKADEKNDSEYGIKKTIDSVKRILSSDDSDEYFSKNYDHFSYESNVEDERDVRLKVSRVNTLKKYYNNDLEMYRDEISDHVPIKLVLDL